MRRRLFTGAQTDPLVARLPTGQFKAWVTHPVHMTAPVGAGMAMGETVVVDAKGKMVAHSTFG